MRKLCGSRLEGSGDFFLEASGWNQRVLESVQPGAKGLGEKAGKVR